VKIEKDLIEALVTCQEISGVSTPLANHPMIYMNADRSCGLSNTSSICVYSTEYI
jgi:hypothetical protein